MSDNENRAPDKRTPGELEFPLVPLRLEVNSQINAWVAWDARHDHPDAGAFLPPRCCCGLFLSRSGCSRTCVVELAYSALDRTRSEQGTPEGPSKSGI
jgi:hypothetical protein